MGPHSTQLLFCMAQERMTAQNPSAKNADLGREQGMPESTRMMQDESHLVQATEVVESEVIVSLESFYAN